MTAEQTSPPVSGRHEAAATQNGTKPATEVKTTVPSKNRSGKRILAEEWTAIKAQARPRVRFWTGLAHCLPPFTLTRLRGALYRLAGFKLASGVSIMGPVRLIGDGNIAERLEIAGGSLIAPHVTLGLDASIRIGKNVSISPFTTIYTATHAIGMGSRRMTLGVVPKPVIIEDGAWIGMQCLILPGVTIGQGAVVAAGSVVNQDVAPNTLVAGNPAVQQQKLPFGNR